MSANFPKGESGKKGPLAPPNYPPSTPQPMLDHSFTLQAVMEMQKSLGKLEGLLEGFKQQQEKVDKRLESIERDIHAVNLRIGVASAVIALMLAVGGFLLDKSWDRAIELIAEQVKNGK